MSQMQKDLAEAYSNFDKLKENLEFHGMKSELYILDKALESLNRYLKVVEKFDHSKVRK